MDNHVILGVHITDRVEHAAQVQGLLTEYGAHIKTRLGMHEADGLKGSPNGLLILEMVGDESRCLELGEKLNGVTGVEVQKMVFKHD